MSMLCYVESFDLSPARSILSCSWFLLELKLETGSIAAWERASRLEAKAVKAVLGRLLGTTSSGLVTLRAVLNRNLD